MEERVPAASPKGHGDHHTWNNNEDQEEEFDDYYNINHEKKKNNNNNIMEKDKDKDDDEKMQIVASKKHEHGDDDESSNPQPHSTYIIQVPKDQIYRVPPPENAKIVERYSNPVQNNKGGRRRCLYWFLSIFFVVAFIVSLIVCVHQFTLTPKTPTFSIKHVVINHPSPSSKKNASPKFQVSLETSNPNSVNDIGYEQGSAKLGYKGKEIGHGCFPALKNEESGKSDAVDVLLVSSKGGLPKELNTSNNHHHKKPLNLNLSISIPLNLKTWLFTKKVHLKVGCNFEVNSVGENVKLLSQKCDIQK